MTISNKFWQDYKISNSDLDEIYNHLLELEHPLDKYSISEFIISLIIQTQKNQTKKERLSDAQQYLPSEKYKSGQTLVFPQRNWQKGKITLVRPGRNPEYSDLEVISVIFSPSESVDFASNLVDHKLNTFSVDDSDVLLDPFFVKGKYLGVLADKVEKALNKNEDLVCIAGSYFPRSLLVSVGIGHLNLCEAVLEMNEGGPLTTQELMNQIELPTDVNANLTEFSLNLALQEDGRFDEVGPAGETLWFLHRLEPIEVQTPPFTLVYNDEIPSIEDIYKINNSDICDELEPESCDGQTDDVTLSINYPHWRAGTLPLTNQLKFLFPTAFETPRVKFTFIDGNTKDKFPGWVIRPSRYIFGLKDWYQKQGCIPGSLIRVKRSSNPGEVIVQTEKQRNSRDWIRTVLVGADGGIVFALLKQVVTSMYDDRMAIVVPDVTAIDALWAKSSRSKQPLEKVIQNTMRELGKLNAQSQIHAYELYAAVNISRRCPPSKIVHTLLTQPWSKHLGDLYFKFEESQGNGGK